MASKQPSGRSSRGVPGSQSRRQPPPPPAGPYPTSERPVTADHVTALTRAVERLSEATKVRTTTIERSREPDYVFIASRSFGDEWHFSVHSGLATAPATDSAATMAERVGQYLSPALTDRVMSTLRSCPYGGQRRVALTLQVEQDDWRVR